MWFNLNYKLSGPVGWSAELHLLVTAKAVYTERTINWIAFVAVLLCLATGWMVRWPTTMVCGVDAANRNIWFSRCQSSDKPVCLHSVLQTPWWWWWWCTMTLGQHVGWPTSGFDSNRCKLLWFACFQFGVIAITAAVVALLTNPTYPFQTQVMFLPISRKIDRIINVCSACAHNTIVCVSKNDRLVGNAAKWAIRCQFNDIQPKIPLMCNKWTRNPNPHPRAHCQQSEWLTPNSSFLLSIAIPHCLYYRQLGIGRWHANWIMMGKRENCANSGNRPKKCGMLTNKLCQFMANKCV